MNLATSLATAAPRSFVHIDRDGQVRSPARYKALRATSYAALAINVTVATALSVATWGLPGLAIGAGLIALTARSLGRGRALQRAARLINGGRLDEGEAALQAMLAGRLARGTRAVVEANLAVCRTRRSDYAGALVLQRAALARFSASARRRPIGRMCAYAEVQTLISLGQLAEARQLLTSRHAEVPTGDYLRFVHWSVELYLWLAEGRHELDADALHERARMALGMTNGARLLGLCAWAHHAAGDDAQAWHLLREAFERPCDPPISVDLPRLAAWMEEHRVVATAAVDEDPYAALEERG
jgi:hypothetical protein